jgi:hypothetical protein
LVPSFGDVRKTILLNEMLGKAGERVIELLPGGVVEPLPPLEVEVMLLVVIELVVVETIVVEDAVVEL